MSGGIIAILAVGVALAGLILKLEARLDGRINGLELRFDAMEHHIGELPRAHGAS